MAQKDRYETVSCGLSIEEMDLQGKESTRSHACITRSSLCRDCKVSRGKLDPPVSHPRQLFAWKHFYESVSRKSFYFVVELSFFFLSSFLSIRVEKEREREGSVDDSFEIGILRNVTLPFFKSLQKDRLIFQK